jgi:hypothetical protein
MGRREFNSAKGQGEEARDRLDGLGLESRIAAIEAVAVVSARDSHDFDAGTLLRRIRNPSDDFKRDDGIRVAGDNEDASRKGGDG